MKKSFRSFEIYLREFLGNDFETYNEKINKRTNVLKVKKYS